MRLQTRAAIDIGTNTAHLIIARIDGCGNMLEVLYRKRFYVFLAEKGTGYITEAAIQRLFEALTHFSRQVSIHDVIDTRAVATEALRKATNGTAILEQIQQKYGWTVHIISGIQEAQFIFEGVKTVMDLDDNAYLIMDIGGGSVEFIEVRDGSDRSVQSFPTGIANLQHLFHHSEPISAEEVAKVSSYLNEFLATFLDDVCSGPIKPSLIGTAGTFEVFSYAQDRSTRTVYRVTGQSFRKLYQQLISMNEEERRQSGLIPPERSKNIIVAFILIDYVMKRMKQDSFIVSMHALKEGILVTEKYF